MLRQLRQKGRHRIVLRGCAVEAVDFAPRRFAAGQRVEIPADVFAGNAHAGWLTVKIMHGGQVLQHGCAAFGQAQLFGQLAVCGKIFHIAKQPRLPLRAAPDHHAVCAGLL